MNAKSVNVELPKVEVPAIEISSIEVPKFDLPVIDIKPVKIETPMIEVAKVEVPAIEISPIEVPKFDLPVIDIKPVKIETPVIEVAKIEIPQLEIPTINIPSIDIKPVKLDLNLNSSKIEIKTDLKKEIETNFTIPDFSKMNITFPVSTTNLETISKNINSIFSGIKESIANSKIEEPEKVKFQEELDTLNDKVTSGIKYFKDTLANFIGKTN